MVPRACSGNVRSAIPSSGKIEDQSKQSLESQLPAHNSIAVQISARSIGKIEDQLEQNDLQPPALSSGPARISALSSGKMGDESKQSSEPQSTLNSIASQFDLRSSGETEDKLSLKSETQVPAYQLQPVAMEIDSFGSDKEEHTAKPMQPRHVEGMDAFMSIIHAQVPESRLQGNRPVVQASDELQVPSLAAMHPRVMNEVWGTSRFAMHLFTLGFRPDDYREQGGSDEDVAEELKMIWEDNQALDKLEGIGESSLDEFDKPKPKGGMEEDPLQPGQRRN